MQTTDPLRNHGGVSIGRKCKRVGCIARLTHLPRLTRLSPALLSHVALLLALFGGAALATGARLKWDPSTYVVVRSVFPREYRAAAVLLPSGAAALVALGHLALVALRARSRPLLLLYAALMAVLMGVEGVWAAWTVARLVQWLHSEDVEVLRVALSSLETLHSWITYVNGWLPNQFNLHTIEELMSEVEADVPRNVHVGACAAALLAALQLSAVLLALLAARWAKPARIVPPRKSAPATWTSLGHRSVEWCRGKGSRVTELVKMYARKTSSDGDQRAAAADAV